MLTGQVAEASNQEPCHHVSTLHRGDIQKGEESQQTCNATQPKADAKHTGRISDRDF